MIYALATNPVHSVLQLCDADLAEAAVRYADVVRAALAIVAPDDEAVITWGDTAGDADPDAVRWAADEPRALYWLATAWLAACRFAAPEHPLMTAAATVVHALRIPRGPVAPDRFLVPGFGLVPASDAVPMMRRWCAEMARERAQRGEPMLPADLWANRDGEVAGG